MLYFGEPWPSGICDEGQPTPTPFGQPCLWCEEGIVLGDQGVMMPCGVIDEETQDAVMVMKPAHKECQLRSVVGSIGHLWRVCSCYGGDSEDPPGMSVRDSAILAWAWVQEHGTGS